jgi:hexosaminidase
MKSINIDINNNLLVSPFPVTQAEAKEVEYYKLTISTEEITLKVNYINGLIRGLETLSQILSYKPDDDDNYTIPSSPLTIEDYPTFPIRGIMIDTSRHFISIKNLKIILDGMMHSKLNTLHWHIVDDDNFSFESKELPFISEGQNYYSQSDIIKLMNYAKLRGIQIIPEFDQPGHVRSWGLSKELSNITVINRNDTQQGFFDPSENASISTAITILNEAIKIFKCNELQSLA